MISSILYTLTLLVGIGVALLNAAVDAHLIAENRKPSHALNVLFTLGVAFVFASIHSSVLYSTPIVHVSLFDWGRFSLLLSVVLFFFGCRYMFFDYTLNKLRNLPYYYVGAQAKMDRAIRKHRILGNPYVRFLTFSATYIWYISELIEFTQEPNRSHLAIVVFISFLASAALSYVLQQSDKEM